MDRRGGNIIVIVLITLWLHSTNGIIGYDCGATSTNLTTLSLLNIEECDIPEIPVNSTRQYIQLLQLNEFRSVHVYQCKVEIDRLVKKCGMFSHTMDVLHGKFSYVDEVSREQCMYMHAYGVSQIANVQITGLKSNHSTSRPATFTGHLDNTGSCSGSAYSDGYGSWTEVVVIGSIKVTLQDYTADVRINSNRVQLRSGVTCELGATTCVDMEGGHTFWDAFPEDSCRFSSYSLLYEGYAERIIDNINEQGQTVYSLASQDTLFALTAKGINPVCGHQLIRTEHPKLVIFETNPGTSIFRRQIRVTNLDIFAYVNSKFVYVERHIRSQINELYRNILLQQCHLEKQTLQNALAIATQAPDIFAYHLMKGPGFMALLAGEVIHIVKCVPVEVKLIQTTSCYNELPVSRNNETYFMTPQTHILLRQGTQTTCNPLAPTMYLLGDAWYKFTPKPVDTIPPTTMKPLTKPTWKYVSPGALATSGIYTDKDLEELRDHIMFPAERPSVLNTVARGIMGQPSVLHGGSLSNLLDEASIEKIATSAWERFWSKFLIFGNVSAGILGIYLCVRGVKLILDTFVHGYALHTVYGWSIYLIGAIWDSVTQLLLHLGKGKPGRDPEANKENQTSELSEKESRNPRTVPTIPEAPAMTTQPQPIIYPLPQLREANSYNFKIA